MTQGEARESMDLAARRYREALAHQVYGIVLVSEEGRVEFVNQQFCDLFGFDEKPAELVGMTSSQFVRLVAHAYADPPATLARIRSLRAANVEHLGEEVELGDGRTILVDYSPIVVDGRPSGRLWQHRDITAIRRSEQQLQRNRRLLHDIIEHSGTLIAVKNVEGRYELVNKRWEEVTGHARENVIGRTDEELFSGRAARQFRSNDLEAMTSQSEIETEESLEDEHGRRSFISIKFPLYDEDGNVRGVCAMITEITARKEVEEQIMHLATHDGLTDLPRMQLARDRLTMAFGMARRQNTFVAVMFVDLDGFKVVNDTLGHEAGDRVLKKVAQRLLSCVRETDTVARVGGDEFLVVATGLRTQDDAARIAEKIVHQVAEPLILEDGRQTTVGASVGIALCRICGEDPDRLIRLADAAMYRVKNSGKNGYAFAEPTEV